MPRLAGTYFDNFEYLERNGEAKCYVEVRNTQNHPARLNFRLGTSRLIASPIAKVVRLAKLQLKSYRVFCLRVSRKQQSRSPPGGLCYARAAQRGCTTVIFEHSEGSEEKICIKPTFTVTGPSGRFAVFGGYGSPVVEARCMRGGENKLPALFHDRACAIQRSLLIGS